MANDWQAGDLAECIIPDSAPPLLLEVGRIYRVLDVNADWTPVGLCVEGATPNPDLWDGFCSTHFRKVSPPKHEDCEPEFVTLLKRIKRRVGA